MYHVSIKTDATTEPVAIGVVKNYIKYDESDAAELSLITSLAKSSRQLIEIYLNISLVEKTYLLEFDHIAVDSNYIKLPYGPVKTFTSLTSYDSENTATVVPVADYQQRGQLFKELFIQWLNTDCFYVAEYIAGYGSATEVLPDVLINAICKQTFIWYNRNDGTKDLDSEVIAMIAPYSKQSWI